MIKQFVKDNYFIYDAIIKIKHRQWNKNIMNIIDSLSVIDSILNIESFIDVLNKINIDHFSGTLNKQIFNNKTFSPISVYWESLCYGHLTSIKEYTHMHNNDLKYFPIMEHGVNFSEDIDHIPVSRICQGPYLVNKWHDSHPYVPIFTIGPYINYAENYYNEQYFQKLKYELGKTILIFPSHTYEMSKQEYNMSGFVKYVMNKYSKDYDTIMVSAYWADLNSPLYKYFKEAGAMIVSAGFRGDFKFLSRLKTIISLSDYVVGNELGTFVGYAFTLNKPVSLINTDINYTFNKLANNTLKKTIYHINRDTFYEYFVIDQPHDKVSQSKLCDKFWGINHYRTKEYLQDILAINKTILVKSYGNINKIPNTTKKLLDSSFFTHSQHEILKEAVGII